MLRAEKPRTWPDPGTFEYKPPDAEVAPYWFRRWTTYLPSIQEYPSASESSFRSRSCQAVLLIPKEAISLTVYVSCGTPPLASTTNPNNAKPMLE